jgi:hypothetical protein
MAMTDYSEIGRGGLWIKEGKRGKFLSWEATFQYNGHEVTARGVAFKNERKGGNQPDYNMRVSDAFPAKPKEKGEGKGKDEGDIPF